MQDWVLANIIVFFASLLQATTGFGFAIMATPFLLLVYNSRDCIQLSILLSLAIAIIMTPKLWRDIHYGLLRKLIVGSIIGLPLGLLLFVYASLDLLKIFVGIVTLIVAVFSLIRRFKQPTDIEASAVVNEPGRGFLCGGQGLVGMFAGIFTASLGMPGVPLALYFSMKNIGKEIVRSTTLAFFVVVYALSAIVQALTVHIPDGVIWTSLQLLPAVVAGIFCGYLLFPRVSQAVFQLSINAILMTTGLYMLTK